MVRNVVYARVRGRPLKLDLYLPRRPLQGANLAPAVLYIHGGGWVTGHRRFASLPLLYHLASHGVAVATVDYRLAPANRFPAQLRDTKRALQWLRQHALRRGIDPETIIVAGESAGAHVALLAALTPGDEDLRWAQLGRMPRGAARSPRRIAQAGGRECGIGHGCPRLRRPVRLPRPAGRGRALFRAGNAGRRSGIPPDVSAPHRHRPRRPLVTLLRSAAALSCTLARSTATAPTACARRCIACAGRPRHVSPRCLVVRTPRPVSRPVDGTEAWRSSPRPPRRSARRR